MRRSRHLIRLAVDRLESRLAPAVYSVTTNADAGAGSLRAAVLAANANPGADSIEFDATFFSIPRTITLLTGTLAVTDSVTITGTSAANCSISGNNNTTVFTIGGSSSLSVTFSRLTIRNGFSVGGASGIVFGDDAVTVNECTITGCVATSSLGLGGGVGQQFGTAPGSLRIQNSTITSNTAFSGGGFAVYAANSVVVTGSTLAGNSATSDGAAGFLQGTPQFTIESSTVSGNRTSTSFVSDGGGIYFLAPSFASGVTVRNATFSGNTAGGYGGGLFVAANIFGGSTVTVNVRNATVASNRANRGGGLGSANLSTIVFSLSSSIVSGNTSTTPGSADFIAPNVAAKASAIGSTSGIVSFSNLGGNFIGASLSLGALANNGGPTQTHALGAGSPILDKGENVDGLFVDQRGLPRSYGPTDIGAFELIPAGKPYALGVFPTVTASSPSVTLTVTYFDDAAIQISSLGDGDIRVTGPGGFLATGPAVKYLGVNLGSDGTPRTATYSVAGPGGSWDPADFGQYQVFVEAAQVSDTVGNTIPFGQLGVFDVVIPISPVVTNANDSGPGSLRQAILDTNANPAADSITFAIGGPATITLTSPLTVTDSLTILGPGADSLTISGGGMVQILDVNAANTSQVHLSGLRVAQGFSSTGGGLRATNLTVSLTDMVFDANRATSSGGAIAVDGPLTVTRSVFANNKAMGNPVGTTADGGAVALLVNSVPVIIDSYFFGNQADDDGGAIHASSSVIKLSVDGSTFFDNRAADGGAIALNSSSLTARNSTFAGNTASGSGGAIATARTWAVTLRNSTLSDNSASVGGGLAGLASSPGVITINSSVLANFATNSPDILGGAQQVALTESLVRSPSGFVDTGANALPFGLDPRLGALAFNGGPTPTMLPLPGSPLRDRGANPTSLITDQRGTGFARTLGSATDIGAVESTDASNTPIAIAVGNPSVVAAGASSYQLKVTYSGTVALNSSSFGDDDIRVVGPNGFDVSAKFVAIDTPGDGSPRTVTYELTPPGGTWDSGDNGLYSVMMQPAAVSDTATTAVPAGAVGSLRVAIARSFVVTNTLNAGPGSLRQAVVDANANAPAPDTITFSLPGNSTIALTSEIVISDAVVITGPTSTGPLTISGGKAVRIFNVEVPGVLQAVTMSDLILTGGQATVSTDNDGGAIASSDESITLANMQFVGNTVGGDGGAIVLAGAGALVISDSIFHANTSNSFGYGGAIWTGPGASLSVTRSQFTSNSASYQGGAIFHNGGPLLLDSSQFSSNLASNSGGAIAAGSGSSVSLSRVEITGNSSGSRGGGLFNFFSAPLSVAMSSISGNFASSDGGGVYWGGGNTTLQDTTLSGNTSNARGGGAILFTSSGSTMLIDRSTFSGNVAKSTSSSGGGGGLLIASFGTASSITVLNSTVSGNSAASVGGGIGVGVTSPLINIRNSTIVGNTASGTNGGGGVGRTSSGSSTIAFESTIVAGNSGVNPDLYSPGTISAKNSAVGASTGVTTYSNLGGNLGFGIDLKLGPLTNNGGPTPTHMPMPGSPLLNAGSNPAGQSTDQRGRPRVSMAADIGAVEVQPAAKVLSVTINGGAAQRSRVTSLTLQFDSPVVVSDVSQMLSLTRVSDSATVTLAVVLNSAGTQATVAFTGGAVEGDSLADGRYTLTARAAHFAAEGLDGNGDGTAGDDFVLASTPYVDALTPATGVFRLAGDATGNGKVEADDFLAFRLAFLSSNPVYDFDNSGTVDAADFLRFRLNFLLMV